MSKSTQEVLHEGWLTKSPPTSRIWRARWRRRWFTLRHSGELPGQYFLEYYTDRNCRKLKGTIDLDQCEQVDAGLRFEQRKLKFPYMFDIRTPSRIYYLAAESEQDMKSWVDCICNVCGLKASSEDVDDNFLDISMSAAHTVGPDSSLSDIVVTDTPPISPVSSSPYIPISECISGHPRFETKLENFQRLMQNNMSVDMYDISENRNSEHNFHDSTIIDHGMYDPRFYDSPRQLAPPKVNNRATDSYSNIHINNHTPPLQSPTDSENVFIDETVPLNHAHGRGGSYDSSCLEMATTEKLNKLSVYEISSAPPRPPKPSHLGPAPNYFNLPNNSTLPRDTKDPQLSANSEKSNKTTSVDDISYSNTEPDFGNETYDFPRSHQIESTEGNTSATNKRHCYNNAAPSFINGQFQYDTSPANPQQHQIFKYDPDDIAAVQASPHSSTSTMAIHSNLPSPHLSSDAQILMPPPVVLRSLKPNMKPKRKLSDSPSVNSEPHSPGLAPSVDRKLKPSHIMKKLGDGDDTFTKSRKQRAAPSPTPPGTARSQDNIFDMDQASLYDNATLSSCGRRRDDFASTLQYLDLDLDKDKDISLTGSIANLQPPKEMSKEMSTVYKTVDFIKTEAIKRTRQNVEEERKQCNKDT